MNTTPNIGHMAELIPLTDRQLTDRETRLERTLADSIGPRVVDEHRRGSIWRLYREGNATARALVEVWWERRRRLVYRPFPIIRYVQPKTWAGALVTRDDAFDKHLSARKAPEDGYRADDVAYYPDSHQGV